ncbi:hypothetical protein LCGC14_0964910 [marine sediment metagenome]|uniref:Uncharacterized protein n=1 Tax=marine sediment metagenome TaxID=412755 RepID=A0A0F9RJX6_9ZZZZ
MDYPNEQIERLASFIMEEVPGEPSASEGAVDCAIRILREKMATKACLHCGGPVQERALLNRPANPYSDDAHEDCWDGFWCPSCQEHWSQVGASEDDLCPRALATEPALASSVGD